VSDHWAGIFLKAMEVMEMGRVLFWRAEAQLDLE